MTSPLEFHRVAVKKILKYLSDTITHRLILHPTYVSQKLSLHLYGDSNWESDPDEHCSTYGSCIFFGLNILS